ncbi:mitochondrial coenzyme A diphosphatase NUDT8 isoform X2 [Chaetodon trifascialis]|uniref:mitochondrial coenzyme A diphosphatase NUDT8 isoform X2 n=1 Tax=Chaetodon trifascialis TaxID=109706 RepID=UPI003994E7B6
MLRVPQILSCPIRPLLLLRESHLAAFPEHTGAGWQAARPAKKRRYDGIHGSKEGSLLSAETASCSTQLSLLSLDCDNQHLSKASYQKLESKSILSSHHQPPQISACAKAKQVSDSWKCTVVEDLGQNLQAVSTYQDCFSRITCLQPWRTPWDICQPSLSFTNKTHLVSHLCHREQFVRSFSLSTCTSWILNHFQSKPQSSSITFHQTRAVHQTAPQAADAWRDCLSPENESRCRQSLGPNLKLYEADNGRQGVSQSQGKNQAKWASVLVSLCSVEDEPAFLFTLRSSALKGRHKGDVWRKA